MKIEGKELKITPASFEEARRLAKAVERAVKGNKIDLPSDIDEELSPEMLGGLIDAILSVDLSDEVEEALFECAKRASLGDEERITKDFFEPVERRKHFYPVMWEVLQANLAPFFGEAFTKLQGLAPKNADSLMSRFTKRKK